MIGVMADELVSDARSSVRLGDFGSWMASEQRRIFLLCRRMLQDPGEADSAAQDTFLKAYKALQKGSDYAEELDDRGKWLTRIAVNTCLDRLRSARWRMWRRRPAPEEETAILQSTAARSVDAESQVFAKQIQTRLEQALMKLSERQRAVFMLRHYEGLALEEIASVLKLDAGTVKAHLFRATQKLRNQLQDLYTARCSEAKG
jgi:RNA polymerase sigma-70 factor (ECF subfamily)